MANELTPAELEMFRKAVAEMKRKESRTLPPDLPIDAIAEALNEMFDGTKAKRENAGQKLANALAEYYKSGEHKND